MCLSFGHAMMHHACARSALNTARNGTTVKECERQRVEEQNVENDKGKNNNANNKIKTHSHILSLYIYLIHWFSVTIIMRRNLYSSLLSEKKRARKRENVAQIITFGQPLQTEENYSVFNTCWYKSIKAVSLFLLLCLSIFPTAWILHSWCLY